MGFDGHLLQGKNGSYLDFFMTESLVRLVWGDILLTIAPAILISTFRFLGF